MAGLAGSPSSYIRVYLYIPYSFLRITPLPQFSDVIAGAGNRGLPAAFRTPYDIRPVAKNETNRRPLNCRVKNRFNRVFLRNNPVKQYFLVAWTPLPIKPKNRIRKLVNGARNERQIDHLLRAYDKAEPLSICGLCR
jgi:hypothetical protein